MNKIVAGLKYDAFSFFEFSNFFKQVWCTNNKLKSKLICFLFHFLLYYNKDAFKSLALNTKKAGWHIRKKKYIYIYQQQLEPQLRIRGISCIEQAQLYS